MPNYRFHTNAPPPILTIALLALLSLFATKSVYAQPTSATTQVIQADADYQLTWLRTKRILKVDLCVPHHFSKTLINHNREESKRLIKAHQGTKTLTHKNGRLFPQVGEEKCINYSIDITPTRLQSSALSEKDTLVLNTQTWLWYNDNFKLVTIEAFDENGSRLNTFLPFQKANNLFKIANTGLQWESRSLLGNVDIYKLALTHTTLEIAIAGNARQRHKEWLKWLEKTALAVESVFGYYPINHAKVIIVPIGSRSGPIPWGEVQRGGFPSVHFFIDETRPIQEFIDDWTGSHELSHLLLPKLSYKDRWVSEGIASYYQNVARSRSALLSKEAAWNKLKQGFARGRRDFNNRSLRNANKIMHVYWGGVAYFFLADLRLREQGQSLDLVLQSFNQCCLPSFKRWTAEELANTFDVISNTNIFTNLLRNEALEKQFPISPAFEQATNPLLVKHLDALLGTLDKKIKAH